MYVVCRYSGSVGSINVNELLPSVTTPKMNMSLQCSYMQRPMQEAAAECIAWC